jgi:hypothetical protein
MDRIEKRMGLLHLSRCSLAARGSPSVYEPGVEGVIQKCQVVAVAAALALLICVVGYGLCYFNVPPQWHFLGGLSFEGLLSSNGLPFVNTYGKITMLMPTYYLIIVRLWWALPSDIASAGRSWGLCSYQLSPPGPFVSRPALDSYASLVMLRIFNRFFGEV